MVAKGQAMAGNSGAHWTHAPDGFVYSFCTGNSVCIVGVAASVIGDDDADSRGGGVCLAGQIRHFKKEGDFAGMDK